MGRGEYAQKLHTRASYIQSRAACNIRRFKLLLRGRFTIAYILLFSRLIYPWANCHRRAADLYSENIINFCDCQECAERKTNCRAENADDGGINDVAFLMDDKSRRGALAICLCLFELKRYSVVITGGIL